MTTEKVVRFPDVKTLIFFGSGFVLGFFAPNNMFEFLTAAKEFTMEKTQGATSSGSDIEEGKPIVFIIIAVIAGILALIKKFLTFAWGVLAGFFLRSLLIFTGVTTSKDFLGDLIPF